MYGKFVKAIHEVQQKSNFKNLLLEKKLAALADTLEKKVRVILRNFYEKKTNLLLVTLRNNDGDGKRSNRFNEQNNTSARASRFLVNFFAVPAQLRCVMSKF